MNTKPGSDIIRWIALGGLILMLAPSSPWLVAPASAQQPVYNTAFLTDAQLEDYNSMTVDQIRAFLNGHNSYFRQLIQDVDGQTFDPPEVIAQAARQYRINPKVILATLQKEISGVTRSTRPSDAQMHALMGCSWGETARQQLTCAAERFRSYYDYAVQNEQTPTGWAMGRPKNTQDGVTVMPATWAVAGQFTYTPYAGANWDGQPVCNGGRCGGVFLFYDAWVRFGFDKPSQGPPPQPPNQPLHIGIEAGHGPTDSGSLSCDRKYKEADVTIGVANHLIRILQQQGYVVDLFRGGDQQMHGYTAEVFVSLHNDWCAPGAKGYKVSRYGGTPGTGLNGSGDASDRLVQALWDEYGAVTGLEQDRSAGHFPPRMVNYYALAWIDSKTPGTIIEMGWWSGDEDALLNRQENLARGIAAGLRKFLTGSPAPSPVAGTATAFVTDISGSMGDMWQGGVKLESAKAAATQFINMLERESRVGNLTHQAALAVFSTDAALELPLTTDYEQARRAIATLGVIDMTNIGAGLTVANDELANAPPDAKRIIILLSDGQTNTGLSRDEILAGPVQDAVKTHTCIYTVGFGDPGDIDEDLLRKIAQTSGCGQYYYAPDAFQLEDVYVRLRHKSTGILVADQSGTVAQGKTTLPIPIDVPLNQSELHVTLNWPGSRLDLILTDPQGQGVDNTYPGATLFTDEPPVYAIVRNPVSGTWQAQVYGADVPQGTTDYNLIASTRSAPVRPTPPAVGGSVWTPLRPGSRGPIILLLTLLVGVVAALGVAVVSRRPMVPRPLWAPPPRPFGTLQVTTPGEPSRTALLSRLPFTIGRRRGCDLVLSDPQASRTHARISPRDGDFVLEDLGSTNGTLVNGQQIQRHVLRPGDEIQIGQTRLRFSPSR